MSTDLVTFVARFEGFRSKPYYDAVGVLTIGYGETSPAILRNYRGGISQNHALALLKRRLAFFTAGVDRMVKVEINANERAALTSLAYNIGLGAFAGSTLLRKLNAGDRKGAADEFGRWNKGGGRVLLGLTRRRAAEAALFQTSTLTKRQKWERSLRIVRAKAKAGGWSKALRVRGRKLKSLLKR